MVWNCSLTCLPDTECPLSIYFFLLFLRHQLFWSSFWMDTEFIFAHLLFLFWCFTIYFYFWTFKNFIFFVTIFVGQALEWPTEMWLRHSLYFDSVLSGLEPGFQFSCHQALLPCISSHTRSSQLSCYASSGSCPSILWARFSCGSRELPPAIPEAEHSFLTPEDAPPVVPECTAPVFPVPKHSLPGVSGSCGSGNKSSNFWWE